jgi:hypothetical protein
MRVTKDPMPFEMVAPDAIYPDNLERIVQRAMKREIQDRYPTMAALHADLQELGRVQPAPNMTNQSLRTLRSQAHVAIPEPAPVETKVRWKEFAALAAFIILFASVVGVFGWMSMKKQPKTSTPAPHVVAPAPKAQPVPASAPTNTHKSSPGATKKTGSPEAAKPTPEGDRAKAAKPKIIPLPEDIQEDIARAKADRQKSAQQAPLADYAQGTQNAQQPFPRLSPGLSPSNLNGDQRVTWNAAKALVADAFEYRKHNNFRKAIECMDHAGRLFASVGDTTNASNAQIKRADFMRARELSKMNRSNRPFRP